MPKHYNAVESEWSYLVSVDDVERTPKVYNFQADETQRINLARRLMVVSVERAQAAVTVQKLGGGVFHVIGHVDAEITQSCVVSLAPVQSHVEDDFEGWFGDKGAAVNFAKAKSDREAKKGHIEAEILDEAVDPEPIIGGKMDVGELATQYLSLAIDPYPHAQGVSSEYLAAPSGAPEAGAEIRKNPFDALKDWKEKR